MTGTILDALPPEPFWRWGRRPSPTALQLAQAALDNARRDALEHAQKQEYHAAMLAMLRKREARLQAEVQRLNHSQGG